MHNEDIHRLFAGRGAAFLFVAAAMPVGLLSFRINEVELLPGFVAWLMLLPPFLALRDAMEAARAFLLPLWGLLAILVCVVASFAGLFVPELGPLVSFAACFGLLALIRLCGVVAMYMERLEQHRLSRGWKLWRVLLWIFLAVRLFDAAVGAAFLISGATPWNRTVQLGSPDLIIALLVAGFGIILAIIVHGSLQCGGMITLIRTIKRSPWLLPSSTTSGPPEPRHRDR